MNVFPFEIKKEIFTFIRLSLAVWFELGGNVICKRFIPTPHFFFSCRLLLKKGRYISS